MGYLQLWDRGGKTTFEADTLSCSHCQRVMNKKEWQIEGPWCWSCAHPICLACLNENHKTGCVPFLKKVEEALHRQRLLAVL